MESQSEVELDIEEKEQNLALLALGLHRLAARLDDAGFDMSAYVFPPVEDQMNGAESLDECYDSESYTRFFETRIRSLHGNECGTTACAAGHGPLFGIRPRSMMCWYLYSTRMFGSRKVQGIYGWCFRGDWSNISEMESREAAAKRIAWLLQIGDICRPHEYNKWHRRPEFKDWEPDWDAIEAMIPDEKLEGIAWLY